MTTREIDSVEVAFDQGATLSPEEKRRVIVALREGVRHGERIIETALETKQVETANRALKLALEAAKEENAKLRAEVERLKADLIRPVAKRQSEPEANFHVIDNAAIEEDERKMRDFIAREAEGA